MKFRQDLAKVEGELGEHIAADKGWILATVEHHPMPGPSHSTDSSTPSKRSSEDSQLASPVKRRCLRTPNTQRAVWRLQPSTTSPLLAVGFLYLQLPGVIPSVMCNSVNTVVYANLLCSAHCLLEIIEKSQSRASRVQCLP